MDINWRYGYRTHWSMKNQETWQFAHKFIGKLWTQLGFVLLAISIVTMIYFSGSNLDTLGIIVLVLTIFQLAGLILPIIPTELALRRKFNAEGRRN
ncbi:SdpI family protein [Candidatus Syntrophocurvum alkaliphilum]|nr:SdpI family protein [Candidatus Syntrophocurvum alkaliphilum]